MDADALRTALSHIPPKQLEKLLQRVKKQALDSESPAPKSERKSLTKEVLDLLGSAAAPLAADAASAGLLALGIEVPPGVILKVGKGLFRGIKSLVEDLF